MFTTLIAWAWTLFLLAAAYPLTAQLIPDAGIGLRAATALALGAGGVSLIMLWEGLLGIAYTPLGSAVPYLIIMGISYFIAERVEKRRGKREQIPPFSLRSSASLRYLCLLLPIAATIAFNAGYWAFHRDDAINIYQPQAAEIARTRALIPLTGADSLYRAYPMHMQLLYAHAYMVSGWENDYLAQFVSALLALACLAAAYALAERLQAGSGGIAAFLLATTPTFGAWASSGYVDLPTALPYTLCAVFALRLWDKRHMTDAALAGAMLGLAAWTKNAALVGVPLLGLWLLLAWSQRRIALRQIVIAGFACAAVAAPYYLRNVVGAGFIIPETAWTDQAQRTLDSALIFVIHPEIYGVTGWLIIGGIGFALAKHLRRPDTENKNGFLTVLWWTLPFFAVWWAFASYDPRFLLVILPMLCALSGAFAARLWESLSARLGTRRRYAYAALVIVALALTMRTVWFSVEYKREILRAPFMSDADKRAILGREIIPPES